MNGGMNEVHMNGELNGGYFFSSTAMPDCDHCSNLLQTNISPLNCVPKSVVGHDLINLFLTLSPGSFRVYSYHFWFSKEVFIHNN